MLQVARNPRRGIQVENGHGTHREQGHVGYSIRIRGAYLFGGISFPAEVTKQHP